MKKRTRTIVAAGLAIGLAASLAACSSGGDSDGLTVWYRPGSLPDAAVEGVQAAFPDSTITMIATPDADTKIEAALRSNSNLPDLATATVVQFLSVEDKFVDVNDYGFADEADAYLPWKLQTGVSPKGRQIGIPLDIGPWGYFYKPAVFEEAGLPSDPDEVGELISTWDGYREAAAAVKEKTGKYACDEAAALYDYSLYTEGFRYYTQDGDDYRYDPSNEKGKFAVTNALGFVQDGLCANVDAFSAEWNASVVQDSLAGFIQPVYLGASLVSAAADQSGEWRVAAGSPNGGGTSVGSSLAVFTATSQPELATKVAAWLSNAANQSSGYLSNSLFPSTVESYTSPELTAPEEFYGGQAVAPLFSTVAQESPFTYRGPNSEPIATIFKQSIVDAIASKSSPEAAYEAGLTKVLRDYPQD